MTYFICGIILFKIKNYDIKSNMRNFVYILYVMITIKNYFNMTYYNTVKSKMFQRLFKKKLYIKSEFECVCCVRHTIM